jgi:hypothetical protein
MELQERGIRERSYCLEGGSPDDRYVIEGSDGGWTVYCSERGNRNDDRRFASEYEACDELLRRILADPTTTGSQLALQCSTLDVDSAAQGGV